MKNGNWIPISKGFVASLPKNRAYTELEAAYCVQLDYDNKKHVTINGYVNLWRWGKGKVYRFLDAMNIKIIYPENTKNKQNQTGLINGLITDRNRTDNGLIRLIQNNVLRDEPDRNRTETGLITDRSTDSTIEPITKPNPKSLKKEIAITETKEKELYNFYVLEINPERRSRQRTLTNLKKHLKSHSTAILKKSIMNYKPLALKSEHGYRKDPANFFGSAVKDQYFVDFLPANFIPVKSEEPTTGAYRKLDTETIKQMNE